MPPDWHTCVSGDPLHQISLELTNAFFCQYPRQMICCLLVNTTDATLLNNTTMTVLHKMGIAPDGGFWCLLQSKIQDVNLV